MNPIPQSVPPQGVGSQNFTPASLYVGDLKPEVTEAFLFDVFNTVGPVASIRVCRDVVTRQSLGYAYVNFHSVTDAERALDTMNFSMIRARPCRIMWSQRDPSLRKSGVGNIFVKNLDKSIDHKTLYDTFSMFGSILSCKVATNENGESLGYGFVHYESQDSANRAIQKVDGMVIAAREVHVKPFMPKSQRSGPDSAASFTNVYVKGLDKENMTLDKLKELFAAYGNINSAHLAKNADETLKGFGFVNFEKPEEAAKAVAELHGKDGLYVARAQKREERERELREKFQKMRLEQAEKYNGVNLYVKNLDDSITDEDLEREFASYGKITSAKVMTDDETKRSRGFGFVCFESRDAAAKAVAEMNCKMLKNKPLYVALAQRKEARRLQLQAQARASGNKMPHGQMPGPHQMPHGGPYQGPPHPGMFYQGGPQGMGGPQGGPQPHHGGPGPHGMPPGTPMGVAPQMPGGPRTPQGFGMYGGPQHQMGGPQGPGGPQHGMGPGGMGGPGQGGPHQGGGGRGGGWGPRTPNAGPGSMMMNQRGPQGPGGMYGGGGMGGGMPHGGGRGMGGGRGRGRGGRGGGGDRIQFSHNARNNPAQPNQPMNGAPQGQPNAPPQQPAQQPPVTAAGPLTSQTLARASPNQQKQMIGERIYPKIQEIEPNLAGKITGMLLEMDNTELLHLLESPDALNAKITEAMTVLQQSGDAPKPAGDAAPADQGAAAPVDAAKMAEAAPAAAAAAASGDDAAGDAAKTD